MDAVRKLTSLKIDSRILSSLRVGFMSYLNNVKKDNWEIGDLEDFKHFLKNFASNLPKEA